MEPVWEQSEYRPEHFRVTHSAHQGRNARPKKHSILSALILARAGRFSYYRINIAALAIAKIEGVDGRHMPASPYSAQPCGHYRRVRWSAARQSRPRRPREDTSVIEGSRNTTPQVRALAAGNHEQ